MASPLIKERLEIICGLLWFILDGCWMMEWKIACYIACVCALQVTMLVALYTERRAVAQWVCAADSAWITFNIAWAVGDLSGDATETQIAKMLFGVGAFCYFIAVMLADNTQQLILRPMRFLAALVRAK